MPRKALYPDLVANAEKLSLGFEEKDRAHFKKSYVKTMSGLNARVDKRCEKLGEELAAWAHVYGSPGMTATVQEAATKAVRIMANALLTNLAPFANPPIRTLVFAAVLASMKDTNTAVMQHQGELMERAGLKTD